MNDDSDLLAQFDRLKSQDAQSARPFSAHWDEAERSVGRRDGWRLNPAVIAAALVLVLTVGFMVHSRSPRQAPIAHISQWQSPTASLLRPPGGELVTTMPRFGEPIIPSFKEQRN